MPRWRESAGPVRVRSTQRSEYCARLVHTFWQRIAYLYRRLQLLAEQTPNTDRNAETLGNAFLQLYAVRARSRATQHRLASGATLGAETSIDKVLVLSLIHI